MKKKIVITFFLILFILIGIFGWKYLNWKNSLYEQPASLDLFIVQSFFEKDEEYPWIEFWGNAWNNVPNNENRNVEWLYNKKDFENLDSIYLGLKNTTNEKFYYVTWGKPNSRIRISYSVFKNGAKDSIPFGGFGCGTGIYIAPLKKGKVAGSKFLNPLMYNPFNNYPLPIKNKKFSELFKEIYGDSVSIKFEQATYSLPWNKIPSQMISSPEIIVSTEKIIENWRNGKFKSNDEFEKEREAGFYIKKNGEYELSSIYEKKGKNE
ncbi:hypothetical protein [Polaribacter cellanae]|uniref:Uncharacterized protein n=1 Tax=Polaribacter cellanae TaxID=2818493 RepID=A0A975CST6_9FLAO|nr:hypothetical protein [Polaribacter cellanae]QTE24200.1 hypothetical protein J3359_08040 [Polaribacter cellanae]